MDFLCSGAADHANDFSTGCPADDGVVDEDDTLPFEQVADRVQLEADAEVADALLGLDEGTADVVVADEAEAEADAAFFAYPRAAVTPESGTGTTTSAGTPDSRASWRPIWSRLSWTQRPKMRESGRAK